MKPARDVVKSLEEQVVLIRNQLAKYLVVLTCYEVRLCLQTSHPICYRKTLELTMSVGTEMRSIRRRVRVIPVWA